MCALLLVGILTCPPEVLHADDTVSREAEIRGAALYYIAKFVTWPTAKEGGSGVPLRLCVAGHDALNDSIKKSTEGKLIREHPIAAQLLRGDESLSEVESCHILYLGENASAAAQEAASRSSTKPILTVRAVEEVSWDHTVIQLFSENNKLRIAVDQKLAEKRGLQISSELLRVAHLRE